MFFLSEFSACLNESILLQVKERYVLFFCTYSINNRSHHTQPRPFLILCLWQQPLQLFQRKAAISHRILPAICSDQPMPSSREVIAFPCLNSHYLDFLKIKVHSLSAYVSIAGVNYVTHETAVEHQIFFVHFYHGGCSEKNYLGICFIYQTALQFVGVFLIKKKNKREESGFFFLETVAAQKYLGSFLCDERNKFMLFHFYY